LGQCLRAKKTSSSPKWAQHVLGIEILIAAIVIWLVLVVLQTHTYRAARASGHGNIGARVLLAQINTLPLVTAR
jgi:hypothetical protein